MFMGRMKPAAQGKEAAKIVPTLIISPHRPKIFKVKFSFRPLQLTCLGKRRANG